MIVDVKYLVLHKRSNNFSLFFSTLVHHHQKTVPAVKMGMTFQGQRPKVNTLQDRDVDGHPTQYQDIREILIYGQSIKEEIKYR